MGFNYKDYLEKLCKTRTNKLTQYENVLCRLYMDFKQNVKNGNVGLFGFMDLETLCDRNQILKENTNE